MTQQVRKGYRNHRKGTWAAVLVVLVAVALAIVLPAVGAGVDLPPASQPQSVMPTRVEVGGSNFSCSTHTGGVGPAGMSTFKVNNVPPSSTPVTYTSANTGGSLPPSVTVKLTGLDGNFFAFSVTGARVFHVGVNGGTGHAWYNYATPYPLGVTADGATASNGVPTSTTGLHATKKSANSFYNASWTTFCYKPVVRIEGTLYRDRAGDGLTSDDSLLLTAHQVTATDGSGTTTSSTDATGKYTLLVPSGGSYTVCMAPLGGEVQTTPGTTTECTSAAGYAFTNLTTNQTGRDFAFAGGVAGACDSTTPLESQFESTNAEVVAKFSSVGGTCKIAGKQFVFTTYDEGSSRVAKLSPVGTLSGFCSLSTGADCQIVAQRITWTLGGTSPDTRSLKYDDPPYGATELPQLMQFCKTDPIDRSSGSDGLTIKTSPSGTYDPEDILPTGQTSCLVKTTQGPGPNQKRVDEVYSAYDGKISFG